MGVHSCIGTPNQGKGLGRAGRCDSDGGALVYEYCGATGTASVIISLDLTYLLISKECTSAIFSFSPLFLILSLLKLSFIECKYKHKQA